MNSAFQILLEHASRQLPLEKCEGIAEVKLADVKDGDNLVTVVDGRLGLCFENIRIKPRGNNEFIIYADKFYEIAYNAATGKIELVNKSRDRIFLTEREDVSSYKIK